MNAVPHTAAIALGSNLGDRPAHIERALGRLSARPAISLTARSRLYETDPVGPVPQGPFLNAAAIVSSTLDPRDLLAALQEIERSAGRDRPREATRWGPRTLDLDLLLYADREIDEPGLAVPHPHLRERAFVLVPLAEIAPGLPVPPDRRTVRSLADDLLDGRAPDALGVRLWTRPARGE